MTNQQNQCLSLLNSSYTHGKNKLNKRIYRKRRPAINVSTCYILARPHWNLRSAVPSLYPFSIYNCILVLYWLTSCCSCCQKVYLICIFFFCLSTCVLFEELSVLPHSSSTFWCDALCITYIVTAQQRRAPLDATTQFFPFRFCESSFLSLMSFNSFDYVHNIPLLIFVEEDKTIENILKKTE
jgi:prepilin signal peptidase PulO-like enzyme (type II secretory pathway)